MFLISFCRKTCLTYYFYRQFFLLHYKYIIWIVPLSIIQTDSMLINVINIHWMFSGCPLQAGTAITAKTILGPTSDAILFSLENLFLVVASITSFNYHKLKMWCDSSANDPYSTLNNDISNMSNHVAKLYNANNVTSQ
jgi:hypothetical protein